MKKVKYNFGIMTNSIEKYTDSVKSYHMPGHKNGHLQLIKNLWKVDVTEVEGTDDLHHASGIIEEVHKKITHIYCQKEFYKSKMLVNGSTGGLLAGIMATTKPSDTILISRNSHKAVYHGVMLGGYQVEYVYPIYNKAYAVYEQVKVADIEAVLLKNTRIKTVVITSPTYEGILSDISGIAEVVHKYGALLIVDEAHGAHFVFSNHLSESAVNLGADVVIQSSHKTLPALTQTALIHYNTQTVNEQRLVSALSVYQTSSPSYPFMCSIEAAIDYMVKEHEKLEELISGLEVIRHKSYRHFYFSSENVDITRLTLYINKKGIYAKAISEKLRSQYNIQVEMTGLKTIVAIASIVDELSEIEAFLELVDYLIEIEAVEEQIVEIEAIEENTDSNQVIIKPKTDCSMLQAFYSEGVSINVEKAVGKVSQGFIIPYPPGIPLLVPGEIITEIHVQRIVELITLRFEIYGIMDGEIVVINNDRINHDMDSNNTVI